MALPLSPAIEYSTVAPCSPATAAVLSAHLSATTKTRPSEPEFMHASTTGPMVASSLWAQIIASGLLESIPLCLVISLHDRLTRRQARVVDRLYHVHQHGSGRLSGWAIGGHVKISGGLHLYRRGIGRQVDHLRVPRVSYPIRGESLVVVGLSHRIEGGAGDEQTAALAQEADRGTPQGAGPKLDELAAREGEIVGAGDGLGGDLLQLFLLESPFYLGQVGGVIRRGLHEIREGFFYEVAHNASFSVSNTSEGRGRSSLWAISPSHTL